MKDAISHILWILLILSIVLFCCRNREDEVSILLLNMTAVAAALLLPLANLRKTTVNNQIFPVATRATETFRMFDHHGASCASRRDFILEILPEQTPNPSRTRNDSRTDRAAANHQSSSQVVHRLPFRNYSGKGARESRYPQPASS